MNFLVEATMLLVTCTLRFLGHEQPNLFVYFSNSQFRENFTQRTETSSLML